MPSVTFIKGDKVDNNVDYRDALPVNYYAVLRNIYGEKGYMLNYYGLSDFAVGQGVSRGGIWVARTGFEGQYRVSGTSFIKIEDDQSVTVLGEIPGTDQASLTYSLNNIAIVANLRLYYYNPTDGFRQITDDDLGDPIDIVWADFRFVATDGEFLFQSSELDEEKFEPLAFSGSDFQPDKIWGVGLDEDNELIAFNELTTEYFVNSGLENFTYTRIPLKAVKAGIVGTYAKAEYKDQWYALTRRVNTQPHFAVIQSGSSESISSREIEKLLSQFTAEELSKTVVEVFIKDAVTWMVAHLPGLTLAYNESVAKDYGINLAWSILKTDVLGEATYRGKDLVFDPRFKVWCIGDKFDSTIGFLDDSKCTHYGDIVEGLLFTPTIDLETLSIDMIQLETIPGITQDNDATVFVSRSDDLRIDGFEWTQEYGTNFDYNKNFIIWGFGYVAQNVSMRLRTASRSRMAFVRFKIEAS
jgi:hypothetical protein